MHMNNGKPKQDTGDEQAIYALMRRTPALKAQEIRLALAGMRENPQVQAVAVLLLDLYQRNQAALGAHPSAWKDPAASREFHAGMAAGFMELAEVLERWMERGDA